MTFSVKLSKDTISSLLSNTLNRSQDPRRILDRINQAYIAKQTLAYRRIEQTPFTESSLRRGRTPGSFANLTGRLKSETIFNTKIRGNSITFGPDVEYGEYIDTILRKKGPFAPQGLIPLSPEDLEDYSEISIDFILGNK